VWSVKEIRRWNGPLEAMTVEAAFGFASDGNDAASQPHFLEEGTSLFMQGGFGHEMFASPGFSSKYWAPPSVQLHHVQQAYCAFPLLVRGVVRVPSFEVPRWRS
jgi:hypothetical protein